MNKLFNFIKNKCHSINVLGCISLILFIYSTINKIINFDNDVWFIFSSGRYIFNNGIPYTDVLTFHSDLPIVMQQWLTSLLYFVIYNYLGKTGFLLFLFLISFLIYYLLFKLSYYLTKNKNISYIFMMLFSYLYICVFLTSRPQIITYLILIIALFLSEKYYKTDNKKYLYALPILSLLEINFHSSMWFLLICFVGVFLVNSINNKKKFINYLIIIIIMLLVGFINPYGIKGITYVFYSYGIDIINDSIYEMKPLGFSHYITKGTFILMLLLIPLNRVSKNKMEIRHFLLLFGCLYLGLSSMKCLPYAGIGLVFVLSHLCGDIKLLDVFKNILIKLKSKKLINIINIFKLRKFKAFILIQLCFISITIFVVIASIYLGIEHDGDAYSISYIMDYLEEIEPDKDVKIYAGYDIGGYVEWRGYKPYIDPRGDIFIKETNKKFDYLKESNDAFKNETSTILFIQKYDFDYIIADNPVLNQYLINNKDTSGYELIQEKENGFGYELYRKVK